MDSKLLKIGAEYIAPVLTKLINISLTQSHVHDDWKLAKVTPIYKGKGSVDDYGNYRPISVICHIAKIIEKVILVQLKDYLYDHQFISNVQSAYTKNHSTTTALHKVLSDVLDGINNNETNAMCFIDLQKCFDTIDRDILLKKLEQYGIRDGSLNWFKSYLKYRKQSVKANGFSSSFMEVIYGVPQGSILGPILFLLFINDLPMCLESSYCNLFADDTIIYNQSHEIADAQQKLQNDLKNLESWFNNNNLHVNVDKSCCMQVSSRSNHSHDLRLCLNDESLLQVNETKYLGVTLCNDLSWDKHISSICKKLGHGIHVLRKLKNKIPPSHLLTVYNTIVQPHIDYCITVWGYAPEVYVNRVQRLQNRIARLLMNNYDWDISPLSFLKCLNIQTVTQRRDYFNCITVYRCLNGTAPNYLADLLNYVSDFSLYDTRNATTSMLHVPKPRLELFRQSFQYTGPYCFNSLPTHVKCATTLTTFKKLLKIHLMS